MDAGTVQDLISKLRDLTATKFPEAGFSRPAIEVSILSDDGKRNEKVSMAKFGSAYIAKRDNEPGLYQMESTAVEESSKSRRGNQAGDFEQVRLQKEGDARPSRKTADKCSHWSAPDGCEF